MRNDTATAGSRDTTLVTPVCSARNAPSSSTVVTPSAPPPPGPPLALLGVGDHIGSCSMHVSCALAVMPNATRVSRASPCENIFDPRHRYNLLLGDGGVPRASLVSLRSWPRVVDGCKPS